MTSLKLLTKQELLAAVIQVLTVAHDDLVEHFDKVGAAGGGLFAGEELFKAQLVGGLLAGDGPGGAALLLRLEGVVPHPLVDEGAELGREVREAAHGGDGVVEPLNAGGGTADEAAGVADVVFMAAQKDLLPLLKPLKLAFKGAVEDGEGVDEGVDILADRL